MRIAVRPCGHASLYSSGHGQLDADTRLFVRRRSKENWRRDGNKRRNLSLASLRYPVRVGSA